MTATIKHSKPKALHKIYENLAGACTRVVAVGFPQDKQNAYPDGTSVAMVAAVQVYGSPAQNIPARDFMGAARADIMRHQRQYAAKVQGVELSPAGIDTMLNGLGQEAVQDIKAAIINGGFQELSERTKEARDKKQKMPKGMGDYTPLIDTHHMYESVNFTVRDKDK
jgi:hypothetical protein